MLRATKYLVMVHKRPLLAQTYNCGQSAFLMKAVLLGQDLAVSHLRVELSGEVLSHPHASRVGLKLLLVQHAVQLGRLAAGGGGACPGRRITQRYNTNS